MNAAPNTALLPPPCSNFFPCPSKPVRSMRVAKGSLPPPSFCCNNRIAAAALLSAPRRCYRIARRLTGVFPGKKGDTNCCSMNSELEERILQLRDKVTSGFRNFMTGVAKLEELTNVGSRFLTVFRHELDYFRRPEMPNISEVFAKVIKANNTRRMSAYVDAGYRNANADVENTEKLFSCQQGLLEHQKKVKLLIEELEVLTEECIGIMQEANENTSYWFVKHVEEKAKAQFLEFGIEGEKEVDDVFQLEAHVAECHCTKIIELVILMRVLCKMLKLDCIMQDKIVMSLNLNSSLGQLDNYSLMWELRPYVDDKIVEQCWAVVL